MTSRPLVSIVVIFLDAEQFLTEAVESVFRQTYSDWELVLVDDGSVDGSTAIALDYARRFPDRVRYLTHPNRENRGMSASRNLGIRSGRGDYVALLDADDVWLPGKLAGQVAILEARPEAAMVYGPAEWWYSWSGTPADSGRDFVHELGVAPDSLIEPPTLLSRFLVNEGISPCICSMLVRREVLERVGGFEETFRGLYEDQALCAKIALDSVIFATGECWYRYRQHPGSALAVAERAGTRRASRLMFLEWLASYLQERRVEDLQLWAAIERERRRARHGVVAAVTERARGWWHAVNARRRARQRGTLQ
jgi:glycosyltransferase involved in cell wall biosynthesis